MELAIRYGSANLSLSFDGEKVHVEVQGKKRWELGGKPVEPFRGKLSFSPLNFVSLLTGVWGIEQVKIRSYEGVVMRVSYDWEGWERGDDILKVAFIDYPERSTLFYLMRFYRTALSSFILQVKKNTSTYSFKHWDISFVRDEGELIVVRSGEEIRRFSEKEVCGLRNVLEDHLYANTEFDFAGLDLSKYSAKARWTGTWREHPKLFLKLYASVS